MQTSRYYLKHTAELFVYAAVYRDMAYVRAETTRLAQQLAAKAPRTGGEAEQP